MAEFLKVSVEAAQLFNQPHGWDDLAEIPVSQVDLQDLELQSSELQSLRMGKADLAVGLSTCVRLDLENLACFERVDRQFEEWGVVFENAIALRPSNPAYPPYSGVTVLMSAPKNGYLEAMFLRPATFVSGFVTSSRRTVLTAFDSNNQAIARIETNGANLASVSQVDSISESGVLAYAGASQAANAHLSLQAANIHRITFHAFDGQLTLDDFCFCIASR